MKYLHLHICIAIHHIIIYYKSLEKYVNVAFLWTLLIRILFYVSYPQCCKIIIKKTVKLHCLILLPNLLISYLNGWSPCGLWNEGWRKLLISAIEVMKSYNCFTIFPFLEHWELCKHISSIFFGLSFIKISKNDNCVLHDK